MLNANCHSPHTLHTVGHSIRTLETLIGLLRLHSIEIVIDVRRWPASRRLPHFNRDALGAALKADRIDYSGAVALSSAVTRRCICRARMECASHYGRWLPRTSPDKVRRTARHANLLQE